MRTSATRTNSPSSFGPPSPSLPTPRRFSHPAPTTDPTLNRPPSSAGTLGRLGWIVLALGAPFAIAGAIVDHRQAGAAANQDWPAFVLVTGLLLIGLVARDEGLFDLGGAAIARVGRSGPALLLASSGLVALVTVTLNLDTSVTFVTPVVLAAARRHGRGLDPFAYLVVFMSNAASLLLPGSNLTNLIVLQQSHASGTAFVARTAAAWGAAVAVVVVLVALVSRGRLTRRNGAAGPLARPPSFAGGMVGVLGAIVAMLTLSASDAALAVVGIGLGLSGYWIATGRASLRSVGEYLNAPLLLGLFSSACALGTLGRTWSGPSHLLAHLGIWPTAGIGAGLSAVVNNLPAASLLAARPVAHPEALLVGLNLAPNLVLTGSLAGLLWLQACRASGWNPSVRRFSYLGLLIVPATMAAALGALAVAR